MAFAPCVHEILCTLSAAALGALDSVIDAQIAQLNAAVALAQAQILKYDILHLPVAAANAAAQAALNQLRAATMLLPSNIINGCTDMGNVMISMQQSIDQVSGSLADITQDATRLLSIREELNAAVEQYNQTISLLNELKLAIAECALEVV